MQDRHDFLKEHILENTLWEGKPGASSFVMPQDGGRGRTESIWRSIAHPHHWTTECGERELAQACETSWFCLNYRGLEFKARLFKYCTGHYLNFREGRED